MRLEQEIKDGYVYPMIKLKDVAFTLNPKTFDINGEGDLPLYKQHKFEEGIKTWLTSQLS
jgi:DNA polymerase II small subunit/DNA polymerase delta subunit B